MSLLADTTLLVVWSAGSPGEIRGQRLNTSLEVQGSELGLSGTAETTSARPRTASSGDAFAVVWEEGGGTVMLTTLGADGVVRVGATELATGGVTGPVVAPDLLGGFAVAYQNATDVELIRVNADGVPQAEPLRFTGGSRPELAAIPDGGFVVAYLAGGSVRLARVGCVP
ncbi:MAG: hypothetical protein JXB32_08525 [Deltaproteobacteria bacterium]|nr:hypothetical protein [Deltaproteobacteria bacterium]